MRLVRAWELIALDDQDDGTQKVTAVADTALGLRLVTATVSLSDEEAERLRVHGACGPFVRREP